MDTLWQCQNAAVGDVDAADLTSLPHLAALFLRHAVAAGTPTPRQVHLKMHGTIKVGTWLPFTADQVIERDRGFRWTARIAGGLIRGSDSFDGEAGRTRFQLGGIIPIVSADGPDVTRSALGRFLAEQAVWLPGALTAGTGTRWFAQDGDHATAFVPADGTYTRLRLGIEPDGTLRDLSMARWGRIHDHSGWLPFGMHADAETSFGPFTVVSRGRVGWWYGTDRWPAGEFFRFTIDDLSAS
jgi:hypothetical protein